MSAYKLGDIVIIKKGRKVEDTSNIYFDGNKRFIQIDDLRNDNKIKYTKSDGIYATENDVLIAWDGANAGTVGYGLSGVIGSTIACLEIDKDQFFGAFIGKCLQSKFHEIRQNCTGATIPHIRRDYLLNIKIPNIDKQKQKQIVKTLDTADTLRQKRKEQLNLLDDYLKSVFFEMFGDLVMNDKGWYTNNLSEISEVVSGVTKGRKLNPENCVTVPYMRVANVQDGHINIDDLKEISVLPSDVEKYRLQRGDILLTEGGDPDKLGRGAVWCYDITNCIHQNHIFRVRISSTNTIQPLFLSRLIGSVYGKRYFLRAAKQTTGIATINSTQLKKFPVQIPPIELQNKFASIVEQVEQTKQKMHASLDEMDNHFNALMQRYFG